MASDNVTNYCDNFNNDDPAEGIVTRAPSGPDDFVFSAAVMGGGDNLLHPITTADAVTNNNSGEDKAMHLYLCYRYRSSAIHYAVVPATSLHESV